MVIHDKINFWSRADAIVYSPQAACTVQRILVSLKASWFKHVYELFGVQGISITLDVEGLPV